MKISSDYYSFKVPSYSKSLKNPVRSSSLQQAPSMSMPSSEFYQDRLMSFGKLGIPEKYLHNYGVRNLKPLIGEERLLEGIKSLEELNAAVKKLLEEKLSSERAKELLPLLKGFEPSGELGGASASEGTKYYGYDFADNLKEIGTDSWVSQHLVNFARLAKSSNLSEAEQKIALDLFGNRNVHIAVPANPISDGLVKEIAKMKEIGTNIDDYLRFVIKGLVHPLEGIPVDGKPPFKSEFISKTKVFDTAHQTVAS